MAVISLDDMESALFLWDIVTRRNKTIPQLDACGNKPGIIVDAVLSKMEGISSNTALLEINLISYSLNNQGVFPPVQSLGSRYRTLRELSLGRNRIGPAGLGALIYAMTDHNSPITYLDILGNRQLPGLLVG